MVFGSRNSKNSGGEETVKGSKGKMFDVISFEGDNNVIIHKHNVEDFNTGSKLIVHESQEAVFFKGGKALDSFGPNEDGYMLSNKNLPIIGKLFNMPFGGDSPFHCEVYFINKVELMNLKWGTRDKVQFKDPIYGVTLEIGLRGEMNIKVVDGRKLLINTVGTEKELTRENIQQKFSAFINTKIKSYIPKTMIANNFSIIDLDTNLQDFSNALHESLKQDFDDYGIALERFFIIGVDRPDGVEDYERIKKLQRQRLTRIGEAKIERDTAEITKEQTVIEAEARAQARQIEGYTYQQERGFEVAEKVASNEAVGQFTNMGVGLGTMAGVGGAVGGVVSGSINSAMTNIDGSQQQVNFAPTNTGQAGEGQVASGQVAGAAAAMISCPQCGANVSSSSAFCSQCGQKIESQAAVFCSQCGNQLNENDKFCPQCGTPR